MISQIAYNKIWYSCLIAAINLIRKKLLKNMIAILIIPTFQCKIFLVVYICLAHIAQFLKLFQKWCVAKFNETENRWINEARTKHIKNR